MKAAIQAALSTIITMRANPTAVSEVQEYKRGAFVVSTDRERLDVDMIHAFLTDCYWAKSIPKEAVARSIQNSLCFGIYHGEKQVGFARVISDFATYAYIGDVFVLDDHRGQGLGKWLMQCVMQHPRLQGLRRWSLVTRDAHGLYEQFGFRALSAPERWMEIHSPAVYAGVEILGAADEK